MGRRKKYKGRCVSVCISVDKLVYDTFLEHCDNASAYLNECMKRYLSNCDLDDTTSHNIYYGSNKKSLSAIRARQANSSTLHNGLQEDNITSDAVVQYTDDELQEFLNEFN